MCLKAGAPEKPKKGECRESHGVSQGDMIGVMTMLTPVFLCLQMVQTLVDSQGVKLCRTE